MAQTQTPDGERRIAEQGYLHIGRRFAEPEDAWRIADALITGFDSFDWPDAPVEVIGQFVVPLPDSWPSRDFQTLHIDFGVPLVPAAAAGVARWTALHVPADRHGLTARTRLVPLAALLAKAATTTPGRGESLRRVAASGESQRCLGRHHRLRRRELRADRRGDVRSRADTAEHPYRAGLSVRVGVRDARHRGRLPSGKRSSVG